MFFSPKENRVRQLPLAYIRPNRAQPRRTFSEEELHGLAESIRENGVLQPLSVRRVAQNEYELVAGERRLRACALAGLQTAPCILIDCDDGQSAIFALLENLQRADLGPFEEAEGIYRLIHDWGVTQEEAARRLGKKQSTIANKLRLLRFSEAERGKITAGGLTERHARALLKLQNPEKRMEAIELAAAKGLTVQQTEELVEKLLCPQPKALPSQRTFVVKDVRLFMNTVHKAVALMRQSGIEAETAQNETEDYIECVVRIPKTLAQRRRPA